MVLASFTTGLIFARKSNHNYTYVLIAIRHELSQKKKDAYCPHIDHGGQGGAGSCPGGREVLSRGGGGCCPGGWWVLSGGGGVVQRGSGLSRVVGVVLSGGEGGVVWGMGVVQGVVGPIQG